MSKALVYSRSVWNGWLANECVNKKDYKRAIQCYNNAIELYPLEYRYFVNRSYCYDCLQMYDMALKDADMALMINPLRGKCHFRKGRALTGMQRLEEAQICFSKVLQLEGNDCPEAKSELLTIRKMAIQHLGANSRTAYEVANRTIDINEAINAFKKLENFKNDDKSSDKQKWPTKRPNKSQNFSMRSKSTSYGRQQQSYSRSEMSIRNEKNVSEMNKMTPNDSSDTKCHYSTGIQSVDVLKKLSDFLLNIDENIKEDKLKNKESEKIESLKAESPVRVEERVEQKCSIDDNKSIKSFASDSNQSNDSRSRSASNRNNRNGKKNFNLDQIDEIWEETNERSITVRSNNSINSDNNRNSEPTNPWRFKGLWIYNVIPNHNSKKILRQMLSKFGKITFSGFIPDTTTAIVDYDNPESPRLAMTELQGVNVPNICVKNERLKIIFRPLDDSNKSYPSFSSVTDSKELNNECYFWRTTGCQRMQVCRLKHIPANKGVDRQPWMQNTKDRYKHRKRYETL